MICVGEEEAAVVGSKPMRYTAKARPISQATESRVVGVSMDIAADLTASLRRMLTQGTGGQLSIEDAAGSLGLAVRTLQRRLAGVGLSYSVVRDRVRLEEACRMIVSSDARLIDVAYQLGFSDPAHFSRAFQGWTGMAPRQFRQRMGRNDGVAQEAVSNSNTRWVAPRGGP